MYLNHRFFYQADGAGGAQTTPPATTPPTTPPAQPPQAKPDKSFTQEDLNKISARQKAAFQRMADKRAAATVAQLQEKQRLEGLPENERLKADFEKTKERLAKYETEAAVMRLERDLTTKGLPTELAGVIPTADALTAKNAVDAIAKFKGDVEKPLLEKIAQLEEQLNNANLRGTPPPVVTGRAGGEKKSIPTIF